MEAGTAGAIESIQLETTSRCNLNCETCLKPAYRDDLQERNLNLNLFSSVVDQLSSTKPHVHLQGWGEPLTQNNFLEYIKRLKKEGIATSFTTNGAIMSRDLAGDLIETGLDGVTFSMAGATSATHDGLRGAGSFARVVEAILTFTAVKRQLQKDVPKVAVSYLLTHKTLKELPKAVSQCRKMGIDAFVTVYLTQAGSKSQYNLQFLPTKSDARKYWFTTVRAQCAGLPGKMQLTLKPFSPTLTAVCDKNPINSAFISSTGKVAPCVFLAPPIHGSINWFTENRCHTHAGVIMGDVSNESLEQIWHSEKYIQFREVYRKRRDYHDHQLSKINYSFAGTAELERAVARIQKYFKSHPVPDQCRFCAKLQGY